MIRTDGSGYERIETIVSQKIFEEGVLYGMHSNNSMLLQDGILYVDSHYDDAWNRNGTFCYQVYEDGTLSEKIAAEETEGYRTLPENCLQVKSYQNTPDPCWSEWQGELGEGTYDGQGYGRTLFAPEGLKQFGSYLLWDGEADCFVKADSHTGEMTKIPVSAEVSVFLGYRGDQLVFAGKISEKSPWKIVLVDVHTLQTVEMEIENGMQNIIFITIDGEYVYFQEDDSEWGNGDTYCRLSLETGKTDTLFIQEKKSNWQRSLGTHDFMSQKVKNGYLYYMGEKNYAIYLMRRSLSDPETEEILGDAVMDSGIASVGELLSYRESVYSENYPDNLLFVAEPQRLLVKEQFAGAAEVNECLINYEQKYLDELKVRNDFEPLAKAEDHVVYRFGSFIRNIEYFDRRYVSFVQMEYKDKNSVYEVYNWIGFTFDLETGNRLRIVDVVDNDEAELKEIVTGYFDKIISKSPNWYWEGALDTVWEKVNKDASFYLRDNGICFYFQPGELSGYGFDEVTIPYEEFEMKILVE